MRCMHLLARHCILHMARDKMTQVAGNRICGLQRYYMYVLKYVYEQAGCLLSSGSHTPPLLEEPSTEVRMVGGRW